MHALLFLLFLSFTFAHGDASPCVDPYGGCHVRSLGDGGGGMDPNGGRLTTGGDAGTCIDPNGGRCVRALADEGNGLDPHGGRVTGQADRGPGMDPWG